MGSPVQQRLAVTIFFFISGFGYASWASRIPTVKEHLHLSEGELGLVLFAFPVGLLLTLPITSWLLQRFSSKKIMLGGAIAFNLVLCLPGTAAYAWQLVLVLLAFGITRNLLNLSMNAQAVETQRMFSKSIMNSFHGVWSLAGFAGAALGYFMVLYEIAVTWHLLMVSVALLALSFLFIRLTNGEVPAPVKRKSFFTLPEPALFKFSMICFASMACENTMYDWGSVFFRQELSAGKGLSTFAFVAYMVSMTTGRFLGDWLTNKLGVLPLLVASGCFVLTGFSITVLSPFPYLTIAGFILTGFGVSCVVPMVFSMAGKSTNTNSGAALASISTIGYMGFLFIPPLVGFIAEYSSLRWSFGCIAMLAILIIWLPYSLLKKQLAVKYYS
ncbi:MFS transporter [Flavihumibacter fluvii]|uniref:MFS transporter n=1 Tax=Flavihumibacter fluvii TaxID=2838157 RepID=UPI001BDE1B25|nr:MFS transporter [Flavihumibacter fluvii]ULQ53433.1 MFS transporter [Flavihumibacter fluvii]